MSFDLVVLSVRSHLTDQQADEIHGQICEGDLRSIVPSKSIENFYRELTAKHPEIDDVAEERLDDLDYCPWSVAIHRSDGHLILSSVWSKSEYVSALIYELASKCNLTVYDPQTGKVTNRK